MELTAALWEIVRPRSLSVALTGRGNDRKAKAIRY